MSERLKPEEIIAKLRDVEVRLRLQVDVSAGSAFNQRNLADLPSLERRL